MGNNESRRWIRFFCNRALELIFLAAWLLGTWGLHEFVVKRFPLDGLPRLTSYALEGAFSASTLWELLKLVFWHDRNDSHRPWWQ